MEMDGIRTEDERQGSFVRALTRASGSVALRNACVFIAVVVGGAAVRYLHGILTPLVIAVFLLLLIDGFSRVMAARLPSWPDWLRLAAGVVLIVAGFALITGVCVRYGRTFAYELLGIQVRLDQLLAILCRQANIEPQSVGALFRGHLSAAMTSVFDAARGLLSQFVLVIIILGFLLASRRAFSRKADRMFRTPQGRDHAGRIFAAVRNASEQYVGLQTLKAVLVAGVSFAIMTAVGLPGAPFLAFLIFLAAYVPIIGPIVGALLPALFAVSQFETPARPIILLVALSSAIFLLDNVIMPKIQSDRLNLDPVVVLLSLGFWGILLGLPGALLSTPLTVVVMAVASEFDGARWFALLLSKEGELVAQAPALPAPENRPS